MSQYKIPVPEKKMEYMVGWDNPLETFFLTVFHNPRTSKEEAQTIFGNRIGHVKDYSDFERRCKSYGLEVHSDLATKLKVDKAAPYQLSPLQMFLREKGIVK